MKKKKKAFIITGSVILFVALAIVGFFIWKEVTRPNIPIPIIAFAYKDNNTDTLYICSDGRIFQARKGEADHMKKEELISKIEENNYEELITFRGRTNAWKVQKMYNLYDEVVLKQEYKMLHVYDSIPNEGGDYRSGAYWYGIYEAGAPNGIIMTRYFYTTTEQLKCSDERAYKIVDWMDKVLAKYK